MTRNSIHVEAGAPTQELTVHLEYTSDWEGVRFDFDYDLPENAQVYLQFPQAGVRLDATIEPQDVATIGLVKAEVVDEIPHGALAQWWIEVPDVSKVMIAKGKVNRVHLVVTELLGPNGPVSLRGIDRIDLVSSDPVSGISIYRVVYTDGDTFEFPVTNGRAIADVEVTANPDGTFTLRGTYSDTSEAFEVTLRDGVDGRGITVQQIDNADGTFTLIGTYDDEAASQAFNVTLRDGVDGRSIARVDNTNNGDGTFTLTGYYDDTPETVAFTLDLRNGIDGRVLDRVEVTDNGDGTYTLDGIFDDETPAFTVTVRDGANGVGLTGNAYLVSTVGLVSTYRVDKTDGGFIEYTVTNGANGRGIQSLVLVTTNGLEKTYRITFSDATTFNYVVTDGEDGRGIASVALVSTVGLAKTYRITFTDATTFQFTVNDGRGIASLVLHDEDPLERTKTYRITFNDGTTFDFVVTDGQDGGGGGTGSVGSTTRYLAADVTWTQAAAWSEGSAPTVLNKAEDRILSDVNGQVVVTTPPGSTSDIFYVGNVSSTNDGVGVGLITRRSNGTGVCTVFGAGGIATPSADENTSSGDSSRSYATHLRSAAEVARVRVACATVTAPSGQGWLRVTVVNDTDANVTTEAVAFSLTSGDVTAHGGSPANAPVAAGHTAVHATTHVHAA